MASARTYLDWNATAPLRAEARASMREAFDIVGNPSSIHSEGGAARKLIEAARTQVAALVGAEAGECVFYLRRYRGECADADAGHRRRSGSSSPRASFGVGRGTSSVGAGGRSGPPDRLAVTDAGTPDLSGLAAWLAVGRANNTGMLVSVMLANNETGVIMLIRVIADIVHDAGGHLHVDAVQAAGKIPVDIEALGADFMSISAHMFGGPKGVGALIKSRDALHIFDPLIPGGGQERGTRGGTENLIGIAGMGAAAKAAHEALPQESPQVAALRDGMEAQLRRLSDKTIVFGVDGVGDHPPPRLPNTTLFAVPGFVQNLRDGVRSGRRCCVGRIGLFIRQGCHVAGSGSHGRAGRSRYMCDSHQPWADNHKTTSICS